MLTTKNFVDLIYFKCLQAKRYVPNLPTWSPIIFNRKLCLTAIQKSYWTNPNENLCRLNTMVLGEQVFLTINVLIFDDGRHHFWKPLPFNLWPAPTTNAYFRVSRPEFSRFHRLIIVEDEYHLFHLQNWVVQSSLFIHLNNLFAVDIGFEGFNQWQMKKRIVI